MRWGLHGCVGMATISLFALQTLCGLLIFLIPGVPGWIATSYLPLHQYFGVAILILAAIASATGIVTNERNEPKHHGDWEFGSVLGGLIVLFVLLVLWIVHNDRWKRKSGERLPEEMRLIRRKKKQNEDYTKIDED